MYYALFFLGMSNNVFFLNYVESKGEWVSRPAAVSTIVEGIDGIAYFLLDLAKRLLQEIHDNKKENPDKIHSGFITSLCFDLLRRGFCRNRLQQTTQFVEDRFVCVGKRDSGAHRLEKFKFHVGSNFNLDLVP